MAAPGRSDLKPWLKQQWCIAPAVGAEFMCQMEQVLEVYRRAHDSQHPVVCMDEQPKHLFEESSPSLPVSPEQPAKEDDEYIR